jgi:ataxia telangiectasia mutated family protein
MTAFKDVCRHHSACFRYFFIEKFGHQMDEWHSARSRYTRSVAVNSIVGHVLGIGDRHSSNILVHQTTAELVHIDFGIVFEQGRLLRTPEKGKNISCFAEYKCLCCTSFRCHARYSL